MILSKRRTKEIESIYAVVVRDKRGKEGVVRRDTPYGTIPWTTDDPDLAEKMRSLALESYSNYADPEAFYLVRFDRVKA